MTTPRRPALAVSLLAVVIAVLALASPAAASDRSVKRAWIADDPQLTKLGKQTRRAANAWQDSGFKRAAPLLRIYRRTRALLAKNSRGLRKQRPSSETGARAKSTALRANRSFSGVFLLGARAVRLRTAGRRAKARRVQRQANKALEVTAELAAAARSLFRQALRSG